MALTDYPAGTRPGVRPSVSRIVRVSKENGEAHVLLTIRKKWPFRDLAVDATAAYVTTDQELIRVEQDGSPGMTLARSFGPWIALHGNYVYGYGWAKAKRARSIVRVAKSGGPVEVVYSGPPVSPLPVTPPVTVDVAIDEGGIYILDPELRRVLKYDLDGSDPMSLADKRDTVDDGYSLVLAREALFWASHYGTWRVSKAGGTVQNITDRIGFRLPMVRWRDSVLSIGGAVGKSECAKSCSQFVTRLPTPGDQPMLLTQTNIQTFAMAADDECVYLAGPRNKLIRKYEIIAFRPAGSATTEEAR